MRILCVIIGTEFSVIYDIAKSRCDFSRCSSKSEVRISSITIKSFERDHEMVFFRNPERPIHFSLRLHYTAPGLYPEGRVRPTQSVMYVPLQVNRFKKFILLIVQYKYLKSFSRTFYCPNLTLRTRLCNTIFITQHS